MSKINSRKVWIAAVCTLGLAIVVGTAGFVGVVVGLKFAPQQPQIQLPPALALNAKTDARTKSLSLATGLIDGNVEGLYVLDHTTGLLQCWILNSKTGEVGGIYSTNILNAIGADRGGGDGDYVMTTGSFFWNGGNTGNLAPSQSVCYVGDGATGNVVGFSLSYDKQGIRRGVFQQGELGVVCQGAARNIVQRDQ